MSIYQKKLLKVAAGVIDAISGENVHVIIKQGQWSQFRCLVTCCYRIQNESVKIKWEFSAITGKFSHILIVWKTNFVVSVHVHWTIYENCFGVLIIGVELLDPLPGFDLGLNVGPVMHWSKSSREPGICCIWWQLAFLSVGTISPNNTLDLFFSVRVFFSVRK